MTTAARQLPLDLGHRAAQGRADFLVAPSNEGAVGWIDRWPEWPAPALLIHGPAACGKTHLAAVWRDMTEAAFVDMADFPACDARELAARARHLVLDRIDPWLGDRGAETVLFHLYNLMRDEGRTVLLTMRVPPQQVAFAVPDLASRLRAAPAAAIAPPDDSLLAAVLVKLFADRQIAVGHEVLDYILPRMERSFAAAGDLVAAADRLALAEKKPVSVALVRRVLLDMAGQAG